VDEERLELWQRAQESAVLRTLRRVDDEACSSHVGYGSVERRSRVRPFRKPGQRLQLSAIQNGAHASCPDNQRLEHLHPARVDPGNAKSGGDARPDGAFGKGKATPTPAFGDCRQAPEVSKLSDVVELVDLVQQVPEKRRSASSRAEDVQDLH
jgi:hypothetical protein